MFGRYVSVLLLVVLGTFAQLVYAQDDIEPEVVTFSYDQGDNLVSRSGGTATTRMGSSGSLSTRFAPRLSKCWSLTPCS